jgi:hypothetical protein
MEWKRDRQKRRQKEKRTVAYLTDVDEARGRHHLRLAILQRHHHCRGDRRRGHDRLTGVARLLLLLRPLARQGEHLDGRALVRPPAVVQVEEGA